MPDEMARTCVTAPSRLTARPARYRDGVTPRWRLLSFGLAGALVVAGALCALFVGGVTGEALTIALMGTGLIGAVSLVFLEVGLSEDRERERDERRRRDRAGHGLGDRARISLRRRSRRRG